MESSLKIHKDGTSLFSTRQCRQELSPVKMGEAIRSINGQLIFLSPHDHVKYKSVIRGQDRCPPAFDPLYRGMKVQVDCIQTLLQSGQPSQHQLTLSKPAIPESVILFDRHQKSMDFSLQGQEIILAELPVLEWFAQYRPTLHMMVLDLSLQVHEQTRQTAWELILEEI